MRSNRQVDQLSRELLDKEQHRSKNHEDKMTNVMESVQTVLSGANESKDSLTALKSHVGDLASSAVRAVAPDTPDTPMYDAIEAQTSRNGEEFKEMCGRFSSAADRGNEAYFLFLLLPFMGLLSFARIPPSLPSSTCFIMGQA